jgi:hypothetical protein
MLYPKLFKQMEHARWSLADDVPWARFDAARLSEEQAQTIRMNAITEWAALPATEMFLRDNRDDSDFSAFLSVWFYEEQKHLHVNRALFPNDTVQSRLPDPAWMDRWLDQQIRFDKTWDERVIQVILKNLSSLCKRTFATAQDLSRYRKQLV